jgi:hypothetical protein
MTKYKTMTKTLQFCAITTSLTLALSQGVFSQSVQKDASRLDVQRLFTPSGYMGDGEYGKKYVTFDGACRTEPHSSPTCIKIRYNFGPQRWAGIYWQNRADNWGDKPGNDYSKSGFTKITFWAKGQTGNEILEFKAGDIAAPSKKNRDSFTTTTGLISISREWKQYTLDLKNANLSSVIGGFCWVASADNNTGQSSITFYVDDVFFE